MRATSSMSGIADDLDDVSSGKSEGRAIQSPLIGATGGGPVPHPRPGWPDAAAATGYLLAAYLVLHGLWSNLAGGYLRFSYRDQEMWEWFFAVTAHAVSHLENPLYSALQNHPDGVNLMANTVTFGLSVPLTPVTLIFGPTVTFALALTLGLAGTATAWYWVFSRHVVHHRASAVLGGALCGFAPGMISHANAHPNFVAGFVLPFIALAIVRIACGDRPLRNGLVLGLLTALQIFLGEELLFEFGIAIAVFVVVVVVRQREWIRVARRPLALGLGLGAAVGLVIVAYPLWWQFFGPASYRGIEFTQPGNDLLAFPHDATRSLAGDPQSADTISMNRAEENTFFGWPLLIVTLLVAGWLRRVPLARASSITAGILAILSLGPTIVLNQTDTGIPAPWAIVSALPLFDTIYVSRLTLVIIPLIALLLALATDRVLDSTPATVPEPGSGVVPARLLWVGLLAVALIPAAPTPLLVTDRAPVPAFFSEGVWRGYVNPGGTVVPVPLVSSDSATALHWQVESGLGFSMPEGYFVGPKDQADRRGSYGGPQRLTSSLLAAVDRTGSEPLLTDFVRTQFRLDLRAWDADVLVVLPGDKDRALRTTLDDLVGRPARLIGGVWVWDVRDLR